MMAFEIKRAAELSLVQLLTEALPDFTFYPAKGGYDEGGVTLPKPPFGAVWIDDAEKTVSYEKTYLLRGSVVWVTRAASATSSSVGTDVSEHSDVVNQIYSAILRIGNGTDVVHQIIIHGIDVGTVNEFSDAERLAHGDTISFTMGVSEF